MVFHWPDQLRLASTAPGASRLAPVGVIKRFTFCAPAARRTAAQICKTSLWFPVSRAQARATSASGAVCVPI